MPLCSSLDKRAGPHLKKTKNNSNVYKCNLFELIRLSTGVNTDNAFFDNIFYKVCKTTIIDSIINIYFFKLFYLTNIYKCFWMYGIELDTENMENYMCGTYFQETPAVFEKTCLQITNNAVCIIRGFQRETQMLAEVIMAGFIEAMASKLGLMKRYSFGPLR